MTANKKGVQGRCVIDHKRCCEIAENIFLKEAGLDKKGARIERMKKAAFQIRGRALERFRPRAVYSYYKNFELNGTKLSFGSVSFECPAFDLIDPVSVEGVYAYAICAGDFRVKEFELADQLYMDIWGTSFCDAIRIMMEEELGNDTLSDSFGPGFYGMDTASIHKMPRVVDFGEANIQIHPSGIMNPLKSSAGILLQVNKKYTHLHKACYMCLGQSSSCRLCGMRDAI